MAGRILLGSPNGEAGSIDDILGELGPKPANETASPAEPAEVTPPKTNNTEDTIVVPAESESPAPVRDVFSFPSSSQDQKRFVPNTSDFGQLVSNGANRVRNIFDGGVLFGYHVGSNTIYVPGIAGRPAFSETQDVQSGESFKLNPTGLMVGAAVSFNPYQDLSLGFGYSYVFTGGTHTSIANPYNLGIPITEFPGCDRLSLEEKLEVGCPAEINIDDQIGMNFDDLDVNQLNFTLGWTVADGARISLGYLLQIINSDVSTDNPDARLALTQDGIPNSGVSPTGLDFLSHGISSEVVLPVPFIRQGLSLFAGGHIIIGSHGEMEFVDNQGKKYFSAVESEGFNWGVNGGIRFGLEPRTKSTIDQTNGAIDTTDAMVRALESAQQNLTDDFVTNVRSFDSSSSLAAKTSHYKAAFANYNTFLSNVRAAEGLLNTLKTSYGTSNASDQTKAVVENASRNMDMFKNSVEFITYQGVAKQKLTEMKEELDQLKAEEKKRQGPSGEEIAAKANEALVAYRDQLSRGGLDNVFHHPSVEARDINIVDGTTSANIDTPFGKRDGIFYLLNTENQVTPLTKELLLEYTMPKFVAALNQANTLDELKVVLNRVLTGDQLDGLLQNLGKIVTHLNSGSNVQLDLPQMSHTTPLAIAHNQLFKEDTMKKIFSMMGVNEASLSQLTFNTHSIDTQDGKNINTSLAIKTTNNGGEDSPDTDSETTHELQFGFMPEKDLLILVKKDLKGEDIADNYRILKPVEDNRYEVYELSGSQMGNRLVEEESPASE